VKALRHILEMDSTAFVTMGERSIVLGSQVSHARSAQVFAECIRDLCGRSSLASPGRLDARSEQRKPTPCLSSEGYPHCHER
jgi:hypothetical protein